MIGSLRSLGLALGTSLLLTPGSALAFSDPLAFGAQPLAAGGGGRFFTGSPADGYTCKVCHAGGVEPKLSVTGLPLVGYQPGLRYELVVSWPSSDKVSLALELTDDAGKRAGSLQLPPDAEIQRAEYCEPATDAILAASLTETDGRQVISVPDCGSKRVRFLWTTPKTDVGRVWFSGSAISSDGEGDTGHDGVTDFGRVIGSSTPTNASSTSAQCSAAQPGSARSSGFGICLTLTLLGLRRRRRPRGQASAER